MDPISQSAPATISIRNIGGIAATELSLAPGVTVLEGRNATNRTSLLQAVAAALGSDQATLKTDADEGAVELSIDGDTYSRSFTRAGETISTDGDPYLDDPVGADLFAFLFGSNEARQAVLTGQDLRDIILRPIDTEALNAEIENLRDERERIQARLDELADLADQLPRLEQRRQSLRDQLADKRQQLSSLQAKLETRDADPERRKALREDLEAKVADLNEARSELDTIESRIESESESLTSLRSEREDLTETLDTVPDVASAELDQLQTELSNLRERKRSVESTLSRLDEIIEFNRTIVEADDPTPLESPTDTDVTEALRPDSDRTVECWTCGTEVGRGGY